MEHGPRRGATPPPSPRRPSLGQSHGAVIGMEEKRGSKQQPAAPAAASSPGRRGRSAIGSSLGPSGSLSGSGGGRRAQGASSHSPRGLLTFDQAEACFDEERKALLKDLAGLQRLVAQREGENERLARRLAEAERGGGSGARPASQSSNATTSSSSSSSSSSRVAGGKGELSEAKRRVAALEEELAVLRAGREEAARAHRAEKAALAARVGELEHWVEATGSERAAMVALLRNGSAQCREVLTAAEDATAPAPAPALAPASPGRGSPASSPGRRFRRQHLERVRALQGEFQAMLGRLQRIPCFSTDVPTSPRRYHHHHQAGGPGLSSPAASPRSSSHRITSAGDGEAEAEEQQQEAEARREWDRIRAAHAAGQTELAAARAELSRLHGELAAAREGEKERERQREQQWRVRSLSPRRAKMPPLGSPVSSPARRGKQQQQRERQERWEAENRRVQDQLEALLLRGNGGCGVADQGGRDGGPFAEVEALVGQNASLFYELATRVQALQEEAGDGEEGDTAARGVRAIAADYGHGLAHARRLLVALERIAREQEEGWALVCGFFQEACGVPKLPRREEELRRVLAACRRDVLGAKEKAAAAPAAAETEPSSVRSCPSLPQQGATGKRRGEEAEAAHHQQQHEGLLLLQRAVESVLHVGAPASSSMSPEALALLLRERWLALGEAAGEGKRARRERDALAAEVDELRARVGGLQERLGALKNAQGHEQEKGKGKESAAAAAAVASVGVLRGALLSLLREVSDEQPPPAPTPSGAHAADERLAAVVARGVAELKRALVTMAPGDGAVSSDHQRGREAAGRLIDLLDDHLRRCDAHAGRLARELQAAAAAAAAEVPSSVAARRLGEVEAAVLEALEALGQPPVLLRRGGGGPPVVVDLPESLRRAVGAVKEEERAKGLAAEKGEREARVGKRVLEAERGELRAEVALLRRVLTAYETALHEALAGAAEEGPFGAADDGEDEEAWGDGEGGGEEGEEARQQQRLAVRLRRHVQSLRRLADQRASDVRALERAAAAERAGLLEEQAAAQERASLYWRLARSLRDAARTVLGLGEVEGGRGEEEEGVDSFTMEVEEVKALCIRLLQFGARARGQVGERAEEAGRWGERVAERERECQVLRDKLRAQSAELGQLRDKVAGSMGEVATLRQRLAAQEVDVEGLVTSLARVTEKLARLKRVQQQGQGQERGDDDEDREGEGACEVETPRGVLLRRSSALALNHHGHGPGRGQEERGEYASSGSSSKQQQQQRPPPFAGSGSSNGELLASSEDPLHAILTRGQQQPPLVGQQQRRGRGQWGLVASGASTVTVTAEGDGGVVVTQLEADLKRARAGRKALQQEVKRLQGLVEEQHKTIAALAGRNAVLEEELEAAEAAAEGMGATGGSGAGATIGTVDLEALQAEHDAMTQELLFLRESSRKREADVRASIAQLQGQRALLEKRLRRQSQTVEELQQATAAAAAAGALLQHVQEQERAAPAAIVCQVQEQQRHRRRGSA